MSDIDPKILARMAAMEQELSTLRARPQAAPVAFDPAAFARSMAQDPMGTLGKYGVPVEHVTKVLVAHALGDQAPPEARFAATQGQQVSAMMKMQSEFEAMRQSLASFEADKARSSTRDSLKSLTSDKSKYPNLGAAFAADPSLFDSDLASHKGDATALAQTLEDRLAKTAAALGVKVPQTASSDTAAATGQSTQATAQTGGIDPTPPSSTAKPRGVFDETEHARLRDEIVRKNIPAS